MKDDDIFIRDYFNGKLSEEKVKLYHDQYESNLNFKQLADQIEVETLGIRLHGREQLKSKFDSWEKEPYEQNTDENSRRFPFLKMAIAASFIIGILYLSKTFLPSNQDELFLAYYQPYENYEYTPTREESTEVNSDLYKAYTEYDAANYALSKDFFDKVVSADPKNVAARFFRGVCQIEAFSYNQALIDLSAVIESKDPYYSEAALWYTSLIEIKLEHKEKAIQYLNKLQASNDYKDKVKQLKEQLD